MLTPRMTSVGLLCALLAAQPMLAGGLPAHSVPQEKTPGASPAGFSPKPAVAGQLTPDQRILHVLNRFTFGPTPESIAQVRRMGINKWFDQQLDPARIPDSRAEARLAAYPAMLLPVDQLMVGFPSNAEIRQVTNGKLQIPEDPEFAAVYRRHIALYEAKQAQKAADGKADLEAAPNMAATREGKPPVTTTVAENKTPAMSAGRPVYGDLLVENILALPPQERANRVLAMQPAAYEEFRSNFKGPRKAKLLEGMEPAERELLADFDNPSHTVVEELQSQRLVRDIYSERQLEEVMTTFWLNHFNVFLHKNEEMPYYLTSYDRDFVSKYALGDFEVLLAAVAESPAMLLYLDNSSSTGPNSISAEKLQQRIADGKGGKATPPGINENYARELMELHTLGVNGGYTQKDVTEVAKVFTGWTVDKPANGGDFKFDLSRHEPGTKIVLGHKIKEDGMNEGLEVLHMLAKSPATARFISKEIATTFVSDKPPADLVDRMARTYLKKNGNIAEVLHMLVRDPAFWSPETYQAKVKTPLEYVVSSARASGAEVTNLQPLINALNQMGMPLYACVPPTGYAATADAWIGTGALVTRMNFSLSLAGNKLPGIRTQWDPAAPAGTTKPATSTPPIDTPGEMQRLESQLIPTGVSDKTRATIAEQADAQGDAKALEKHLSYSAGLLLGSPEFQRR